MDYILGDGELLHATYPGSFELADRTERESLAPGNFAKLIFHYHDSDDFTERMWVRVTSVDRDNGILYHGELNNEPLSDLISMGDKVVFMPQHVIDTITDA